MRTGVVAAVLAVGVVLSGCSGGTERAPAPSAPAPGAPPPAPAPPPPNAVAPPRGGVQLDSSPTLEQIRMRGKLLVGLRADEPQFVARDGAGGYRGFDVEIARRLAQGLGLNPDTQVSYRMLPPTLQANAMAEGSVDIQLGGFDARSPEVSAIGPYAITGGGAAQREQFVGLKAGDDVLRDQLNDILHTAVADGSWQRAYDATLAPAGVQARPASR